jgi:hypothetical protein
MLIIGSTALKHWYPYDNIREPKDIDFVTNDKNLKSQQSLVEFLYNPVLYEERFKKYWHEVEIDGIKKNYINPTGLLTLKISHLFWDINWKKHMWDVQFLLDKCITYDIELLNELIKFWDDYLPKIRRSNLIMNKKDFFTNAINYDEGEHDFLHTLINSTPMYTKLLADGKEVELEESKFHSLKFKEKLNVVREEVYVMAYERFKDVHHVVAYRKMLDKFIMIHAPQYIALFAIENYKELLTPNINFIKQIEDGLQKIKPVIK